jgi:hypothetical protein
VIDDPANLSREQQSLADFLLSDGAADTFERLADDEVGAWGGESANPAA